MSERQRPVIARLFKLVIYIFPNPSPITLRAPKKSEILADWNSSQLRVTKAKVTNIRNGFMKNLPPPQIEKCM